MAMEVSEIATFVAGMPEDTCVTVVYRRGAIQGVIWSKALDMAATGYNNWPRAARDGVLIALGQKAEPDAEPVKSNAP